MQQTLNKELITFRNDFADSSLLTTAKKIPTKKKIRDIKLVDIKKPKEGDINEIKLLDDFDPVPKKQRIILFDTC